VEVNSSNGSIVLFETIDDGTNSIIPKLNYTVVQGGAHPRTVRVEGQPLHAGRFRLELRQHIVLSSRCFQGSDSYLQTDLRNYVDFLSIDDV